MANDQQCGAIVLCGGNSTRMGFSKSGLMLDDRTFLECVLTTVCEIAKEIVVVGAPDQRFDFLQNDVISGSLSSHIEFTHDEQPGKGPLEGIRVGLKHLEPSVDVAFVTSVDVPLLRGHVIALLLSELSGFEAVVPTRFATDPGKEGKSLQIDRTYGMTGLYRTGLHVRIAEMIRKDCLRVSSLAATFETNRISIEQIRSVDPELHSLRNVNTALEYQQLLNEQSLTIPDKIRSALGL